MKHQFQLAQDALHEATHHAKARYYTSSISNAYQVVLRSAAGLLYALGIRPKTEREIRIAFQSAFVSPGTSEPRFSESFRQLETLRHKADFDHDYVASRGEAEQALAWAQAFWEEALRLQKEALK